MEKIIIAGDFVPQDRVLSLINASEYEKVFGQVKPIIESADYAIVNLETPILEGDLTPIVKTGPNLSAPVKTLEAIDYAGFNCVTLANNHFYDQGERGATNTLDELIKRNIEFVGAGYNLNEASQILYKEINGSRFAFISCCEHEYSIATKSTSGSNPIDSISQFYQISEARNNADYVVVICHGGIEGYQYPTPRMVKLYRFFIDSGADVVVNHHQHCYNGYEVYNGKPIFYGLGNFCFDRRSERNSVWNEGFMIELQFDVNEIKFILHPYSQCNEKSVVKPCNQQQTLEFQKEIEKLNCVIQEGRCEEILEKYVESQSRGMDLIFTPYRNGFLQRLFNRHILPSIFNKTNWLVISSYLLCESHNDRLSCYIKQKTSRN